MPSDNDNSSKTSSNKEDGDSSFAEEENSGSDEEEEEDSKTSSNEDDGDSSFAEEDDSRTSSNEDDEDYAFVEKKKARKSGTHQKKSYPARSARCVKNNLKKKWDETTPGQEIERLKEIEQTKCGEGELLLPRNRPTMSYVTYGGFTDESSDDLDSERRRKRRKKKTGAKKGRPLKKARVDGEMENPEEQKKKRKKEPNERKPRKQKEKSGEEGKCENGTEQTVKNHEKKRKNDPFEKVCSFIVNKRKYELDLKERNGAVFMKCVDFFRPHLKYMKKLVKQGDPLSAGAIKYLVKLGNYIIRYVVNLLQTKEPVAVQKQWHNYLWIFLSQFLKTHHDPALLLSTYKTHAKPHHYENGERKPDWGGGATDDVTRNSAKKPLHFVFGRNSQ